MPFTAILENKRINALLFPDSDWEALKTSERENRSLRCPECSGLLAPRSGSEERYCVRPHFYHVADKNTVEPDNLTKCSLRQNMSQEHYYLQSLIFDMLVAEGYEVDIEKKVGNRRPDILLPVEKKVIEIQLSKITAKEYRGRTQDFYRQNYTPLWITWQSGLGGDFVPHADLDMAVALENTACSPNRRSSILKVDDLSKYETRIWGREYSQRDKEIRGGRFVFPLDDFIKMFIAEQAVLHRGCQYSPAGGFPHWCIETLCGEAESRRLDAVEKQKQIDAEKKTAT